MAGNGVFAQFDRNYFNIPNSNFIANFLFPWLWAIIRMKLQISIKVLDQMVGELNDFLVVFLTYFFIYTMKSCHAIRS